MRINNVPKKTSLLLTVIFIVSAIAYTVWYAWMYVSSISEPSIADFFRWYIEQFNSFRIESKGDPFLPWFLMVGLPLMLYGLAIYSVISRQIGLREMNSTLNLKSVDFLPDKVKFKFNRPQCNFVCGYNNIKRLEMVLNTVETQGRYGAYTAVSEIKINFTVLNNKHFSLLNMPLNLKGFICKVIDYGRLVQDFSYRFEGDGVVKDVEEIINDYMNFGCKQILTSTQENGLKITSIVFFLFAIVVLYLEREIFNEFDMRWWRFPLTFAGTFLAFSFLIDIMLFIDKWNENKYKGFRK